MGCTCRNLPVHVNQKATSFFLQHSNCLHISNMPSSSNRSSSCLILNSSSVVQVPPRFYQLPPGQTHTPPSPITHSTLTYHTLHPHQSHSTLTNPTFTLTNPTFTLTNHMSPSPITHSTLTNHTLPLPITHSTLTNQILHPHQSHSTLTNHKLHPHQSHISQVSLSSLAALSDR